uniref:Uncharacterized protein n=1 Tax=Anopheles funestus TaxID=62324 RepID=A0A182RLD4_ANOFN
MLFFDMIRIRKRNSNVASVILQPAFPDTFDVIC